MVHDILYLQNIKIQLIKSALGRLIAIQPKTEKKKRRGEKKWFLAKQAVCHETLTRKACQTLCMAGKKKQLNERKHWSWLIEAQ